MIQREDLHAAAATGLLHYRQVEPLLVFLLQREVLAHRSVMQQQALAIRSSRLNRWLALLAALLACVTAGLFALHFFTRMLPAQAALAGLASVYGVAAVLLVWRWKRKAASGLRARQGTGGWRGTRLLVFMLVSSLPLALMMWRQAD